MKNILRKRAPANRLISCVNEVSGTSETYYKTIVDPDHFNLDKDAFDNCDNDLVVSITSQLGGLPKQIRQPDSNDIPNHSAIYRNTVHGSFYIKGDDGIFSETNSPHIQKDVIRLLSLFLITASLLMLLE